MKTKVLIALLQEADPSGEIECNVDGVDIFTAYVEPTYWDGYPQLLVRDPAKKPYYDIVGAKYGADGPEKLTIRTLSIEDALADHPDLPIDYSALHCEERVNRYKQRDDNWRQEYKDMHEDLESSHFNSWVSERVGKKLPKETTRPYYDSLGIKRDESLKGLTDESESIRGFIPSYNERRYRQWDAKFIIIYDRKDSVEISLNPEYPKNLPLVVKYAANEIDKKDLERKSESV